MYFIVLIRYFNATCAHDVVTGHERSICHRSVVYSIFRFQMHSRHSLHVALRSMSREIRVTLIHSILRTDLLTRSSSVQFVCLFAE